jgi:uncharacterized protein YjbJ (UPF0337 family)
MKRRRTQLGDVTGNRCALGRRVGEAEQTEGAVRRRIGQMKLKLLESSAQHGVQNHQAQHLLSRESIAAKVGPNTVGSEVGKDLLLQLGNGVQNRGHRSEQTSMFVGNGRDRKRQLPTVCSAHEDSFAV